MRRLVLLLAVVAGSAAAQTAGITNAAVSGVVKDSVTGQPLADYNVSTYKGVTWYNNMLIQGPQTTEVKTVTDSQGHYRLTDLPPGQYRIDATSAASPRTHRDRRVTVAGQDLENIDIQILVAGKISGKVLDENKEPVPNMAVVLVSREYYMGTMDYFMKGMARTDDRGAYTLSGVEARHRYLVLAQKFDLAIPPHSDVPLDPRLRRRVPLTTYYPNSPQRDGAEAITLRPGEHREHVDIELKKAPSYCIQGTLMGPAGPAPLPFGIEAVQPSSGMSSNGGMVRGRPGGQTGPDGKIRLCDLAPGTYRLTAGVSNMTSISQQAPNVGLAEVTISDRDVTNFKLGTAPLMSLDGEVVWDGDPPQDPVTARVNVSLQQLGRYLLPGERGSARSDIPGTFSLPAVMVGEYGVRAFVSAPGLYVKEVTFGGHSVMHEPVRFGSTMAGATLHVVVGRDGGTVAARVADKDGNPVASTPVLVMPKEVASEAVLQNVLVIGETDQNGQFTSHTLAPGKYFVAAVTNQVDATTDTIDRLWRSRLRFQEVELTAGGSVQVTLPPITVE